MKDLATDKVNKFATYEKGWHFMHEGEPFSPATIEKCHKVIGALKELGFTIIDAFPGTDKGIGIWTMTEAEKPNTSHELDFNVEDDQVTEIKIERLEISDKWNAVFNAEKYINYYDSLTNNYKLSRGRK